MNKREVEEIFVRVLINWEIFYLVAYFSRDEILKLIGSLEADSILNSNKRKDISPVISIVFIPRETTSRAATDSRRYTVKNIPWFGTA